MDGLNGNRFLKTCALSMEDKMVAGALGCIRNYGWGGPSNVSNCYCRL